MSKAQALQKTTLSPKMAPQIQHFFLWGSRSFQHYALMLTLCVILLPTVLATEYSTESQSSMDWNYHVGLFPHFNKHYDERNFGQLNIDVMQSTTSSILVKWDLTNFTFADSVSESTVICETFNGKIVSDKLHPKVNSFRFQFLHSNTKYIVCVYMVETSKATNTSILHYNCRPVETIPMVRSDSIVGVILTLGYIIVMGGIGYIVWYRRARKIRRKEEEEPMNIEESDEEEGDRFGHNSEKGNDPSDKGGGGGGGGRIGGFSNYAADGATADAGDDNGAAGGINGDAGKDRGSRGDCTGGCVPFKPKKEEEDAVQYNAKKREISF